MHYEGTIKKAFTGVLFALFICFLAKGLGTDGNQFTGTVHAVSEGNAYTELIFQENSIKINPGEVETIEGKGYPQFVKDDLITWESSDRTVVTVVRDATVYTRAYITGEQVGKADIRAINAEGKVIATLKVTVGSPSALEKTKQVKASSVTVKYLKGQKGSIKIKYSAVNFASGYQIRYRKSGKWINIDTTAKSKTISKLPKGKYSIKVRPYRKYDGDKYYGKFTRTYNIKVK